MREREWERERKREREKEEERERESNHSSCESMCTHIIMRELCGILEWRMGNEMHEDETMDPYTQYGIQKGPSLA
jgi:hypothetical protein